MMMIPSFKAVLRKISRAYSHWKAHTSNQRERASEVEYTRRLKVELKIHARKIEEMKLLLDREKEKVVLEKARYNILLRSSSSSSGSSGVGSVSSGGAGTSALSTAAMAERFVFYRMS